MSGPPPQDYGMPAPPPPKQEGIGKYILLGGAGCLLFMALVGAIAFFVFYIFQETSEPIQVVNLHLQALQTGDMEKSYSYCSADFKRNTNFQDFQNFVASYPTLKNAKEFSSNNRETSEGMVKLLGNLQGQDGSQLAAEYRLVREGRDWKIQYIRLSKPEIVERKDSAPVESSPKIPEQAPKETDLKISDIQIQKQADQNTTTVNIQFKVWNFESDRSGDTPRIHLIQDLETYGPDGNSMHELSMKRIKELEDRGYFDYADFWNTLTIPLSYPQGRYVVRLIIHDQIGNTHTETTIEFELP